MKTVEFVKLPGETRKFVVEDAATVGDVLKLAGITDTREVAITIDDEKVTTSDIPENGDLICVTKNLKGAC